MADKDGEGNKAPIIIKKIKKGGHGGHHGGAWKVAYADFVTAMMAFFLLLWLLQATTEEQKLGIADYFAPASVTRSKSGSGGVLAGQSMAKEGVRKSDQTPVGVIVALPTDSDDSSIEEPEKGEPVSENEEVTEATESAGSTPKELDDTELDEILVLREEEQFAAAEEALRDALNNVPELQDLIDHLLVDQTLEGMRIQIIDEENESMFPSGSADMLDRTKQLISLVADAVKQLPQQIAIKGHTDSTPYINDNGYSNWELSTDRANSSRRALLAAGLSPKRIASVIGLADTDHLDQEDPLAARNRRISIILLRENAVSPKANPGDKKKQRAAAE